MVGFANLKRRRVWTAQVHMYNSTTPSLSHYGFKLQVEEGSQCSCHWDSKATENWESHCSWKKVKEKYSWFVHVSFTLTLKCGEAPVQHGHVMWSSFFPCQISHATSPWFFWHLKRCQVWKKKLQAACMYWIKVLWHSKIRVKVFKYILSSHL